MDGLRICFLDGFKMIMNGRVITGCFGDSRKKILLMQYLIFNRGRVVTTSELFSVVWSNDDNNNPENALKTLVSRLRKDLSVFGLSDLISTKSRGYSWNTDKPCEFDIDELERVCRGALDGTWSSEQLDEGFEKAIALYRADIEKSAENHSWIVRKSVYYHNLFIKAACAYVQRIREEDENEKICKVCKRILEIDPYESVIALELVNSLNALGRTREAISVYSKISDISMEEIAASSSEKLFSNYKNLLSIKKNTEVTVGKIINEISSERREKGAFVCDYAVFKEVYALTERNLSRFNTPLFLVLVTVSKPGADRDDEKGTARAVEELCGVMTRNMRRTDTISRYGSNSVVVLVPAVNLDRGKIVMERIKKEFYTRRSDSGYAMDYVLKIVE